MLKKIKGLFIEEEGQGLTEYALIIGLVAIAAIVTLTALGAKIGAAFTKITSELKS